jgi:hypothetical protein
MAKSGKPNTLILWGDDIGWWTISYNSRGQMGSWTRNIDRIGHKGATFTDYDDSFEQLRANVRFSCRSEERGQPVLVWSDTFAGQIGQ